MAQTTIKLFVPANRVQIAVEFYVEALGLSVKTDAGADGLTRLTLGDQELHLVAQSRTLTNRQTGLSFHVHNLYGCINHLASEGHLPQSYLRKATREMRQLAIPDPAGNIITLVEAN